MEVQSSEMLCQECNQPVSSRPTKVEYQEQEVFLFDPVVCPSCLLKWCDTYSTVCVNCGGMIPPYSQVGVLKADGGNMEFVHMTTSCWTVGSAFHGYWGKGQLHQFVEIEAC